MGNSILRNKLAVSAAVVTGVLGLGFWIYKQSKNEDVQSQPKQPQPAPPKATIQQQLQKFKNQVDIENPSLEDIKRLFITLANYVKSQTLSISSKIKDERRKAFPKERRLYEIREYFKFTNEGLTKLQKKVMDLQGEQAQLMAFVGINQAKIAKYGPQLTQFMQELVFSSEIPLQDLKRSLQIKTDYLQTYGQKIIQALIEISPTLSQQQKQNIPIFLNIIISDSAFENEAALDKQEYDVAYEKYRAEIAPQLIKLEKVLMPLMGRLQSTLLGMGYGADNQLYQRERDYDDQMGGRYGMNQQTIMEQMEQLRESDPQGFEQMMLMMQAQMGR